MGKDQHDFEHVLRRRRAVLLREAAECEAALRDTAEVRESELEEHAQDEERGRVLARLDDRERRELVEIEAALDRIADETYGRCIRCDAAIDVDRLAVLPATPFCVRCAGAVERAHAPTRPAAPRAGHVPGELAQLDDDDVEAALREAVETDDRIDHEELDIACRRGVVHLDGVLPSVAQQSVLRRIVEDVVGLRDVVDRVRIDETPWERPDRAKIGPRASASEFESEPGGAPDRPPPEEED